MAQNRQGVIYAPTAPTCGDRILDYFVVSECLSQAWAIVAACVIGDQTFGPHSPVRLIVKANSRTVMVRQLKVPIGFGADLPFGPVPQTGCPRVLCEKQEGQKALNNEAPEREDVSYEGPDCGGYVPPLSAPTVPLDDPAGQRGAWEVPGSSSCDYGAVVPHTPPSACLGGGLRRLRKALLLIIACMTRTVAWSTTWW